MQKPGIKARKEVLPERREQAVQFILQQHQARWMEWSKDCVANNRIIFETELTT